MSVLSADRNVGRRDGEIIALPCGVDILYQNGMGFLNTSGYVMASMAAGYKFAGVVVEQVSNTGSAGDKDVRLWRKGIFPFTTSGAAITDVGRPVFATDDQTVALSIANTGSIYCGKIVKFVSATEVWVDIGPATGAEGAHLVTLQGSLTATTGTTGGGIMSVANPFARTVTVYDLILHCTTMSTGAANGEFGIAADGVTSSSTLINTLALGTSAKVTNTAESGGSAGAMCRSWASTEYVTGTASATCAGLVGTYYIICLVNPAQAA